MEKVGQQAVSSTTDLAANTLDANAIVGFSSGRSSFICTPADQRTNGLAVGVRTTLRHSKNAATGASDFDVCFDGTGKVQYNDHVLGTPPLVVWPGSSASRREVSSFLPCFAPLSPSMPLPSSRAIRMAVSVHCFFRTINMTANALEPVPLSGLIILFDQDLLHFDQPMWPITTARNGNKLSRALNKGLRPSRARSMSYECSSVQMHHFWMKSMTKC